MAQQRVLVPLDGSEQAEAVLPFAQGLARGLRAELSLLHVVRTGAAPAPLSPDQVRAREEPNAYLAALAARLGGDVPVTWALTVGDPATEILRMVDSGRADIVAMATYGWSEGVAGPIGPIADRVLEACPLPVVLVKVPVPAAAERPAARSRRRSGGG